MLEIMVKQKFHQQKVMLMMRYLKIYLEHHFMISLWKILNF